MKITIAGASGFIGKNLIKKLRDKFQINALSRSLKESDDSVRWTKADLFSFSSTREALKGSDVAIYLVHSMLPSSKLFQGNFQDTDLFLADNFAKSCISNGVKQIIYMGGLVAESGSSKHLESRREVEDVFKATGIPTTILRAGMVVGDGGSSFEILKNLVLNLPLMILPKWTSSNTQTIFIDDLLRVFEKVVGNNLFYNRTINVVNGERITYSQLIRQTAERFDYDKALIPVPINYAKLSKWWVKLFGESSIELVSPLIDSLLCDLPTPEIVDDIKECIKFHSYREMLLSVSKDKIRRKKNTHRSVIKNVRSIQRLPNPQALSEEEVSIEYIKWLPKHMRFIIKARSNGDLVGFYLFGIGKSLLMLKKIEEASILNRVKFHIVGGLLSKSSDSGWLEFRIVGDRKYTLASINDFRPSLPWYIYKYSQAPIHSRVMHSFGHYLQGKRSK